MEKRGARRGQATVFMVIGVVVLIAAGFFFYISLQKPELAAPVEEVVKFEYAGQEELYNYVMACLKPAVLEGLEIMRLQGGYIYISDDAELLVVKDPENRVVKPDGDSFRVFSDPDAEGNKVPYWIGSNYTAIPSISFLENELKIYVEGEVKKCVGDLGKFREQGYNITIGDLEIDPKFSTAVIISMDFPISMSIGDIEFEVSDYAYSVPVDWERILNAAANIALTEMEGNYLEFFTNNMISLYSGLSEDKLPPVGYTDSGFGCDYVTWNIDDVMANLMAIIYHNIKYMKIDYTNYSRQDTASDSKIYDSFVYDVLDHDMTLHINHTYSPAWGMNFDIKPKQGEMIKPDMTYGTGMYMLPNFCSAKYRFKYYVQYPVLVTIEHDNSAKLEPFTRSFTRNENFVFSFPMKVVIYGNQKRKFVALDRSLLEEAQAEMDRIADEMNITEAVDELFCESGQKTSHNITIAVMDAATGDNLEKADIFYRIPVEGTSPCHIGRTGEDGLLRAQFPLCHSCEVIISKQGYASTKKFMHSDNLDKKYYSFRIEPMKELKLNVKLVHMPTFMRYYYETEGYTKNHNCTGQSPISLLSKTISDPEPTDWAIFTMNSREVIVQNLVFMYPASENLTISKGIYNISVMTIGNSVIEPSSYPGEGGETVTISMNASGTGAYKGKYMLGMADYEIDVGEVYNNSNITLFAPVDYLSSENTSIKKISNPIIFNRTLRYSYEYSCYNMAEPEAVSFNMTIDEFERFFQPVLT